MDVAALREMVCGQAKLADLLEEYGVPLRTPTQEEQISCPFHGKDATPSARHYPATNSMYCFTCKKAWDPISFLMEKRGSRFKEAVDLLARKFEIDVSGYKMSAFKEKTRQLSVYTKKTAITAEDKRVMALTAMEAGIRSCRGSAPEDKYVLMVYLLSRLRATEDWETFKLPATKILAQIKKYSMEF